MTTLQQEVHDLLQKNIFFKFKQRNIIEQNLSQLPEDKLQEMKKNLEDGLVQQRIVLKFILEKNPHFLDELKGKIVFLKKEKKKNEEIQVHEAEEKEIAELESLISNL